MENAPRQVRQKRWWQLHHLRQLGRERERWIQIRLIGWALIGIWQLLSLISEFYPILQLESKTLRVIGKLLGFVGLMLVAIGFERLMHVATPPTKAKGRS